MTHPVKQFAGLSPPNRFGSFDQITQWCRLLYDAFVAVKSGKLECVGQKIFSNGAVTTVLQDVRLSPQSVVVLDPMTHNASILLVGGIYALEINRNKGQWTFTHGNMAVADLKFAYAVIG